MKTKTETHIIGGITAKLTIEIENGEALDTTVQIEGGTLCCVAGSERLAFIKDLRSVIEKYGI